MLTKPTGKVVIHVELRLTNLFKGLQNFLPLTKMSEEKLQRPCHQGRVVMHTQVQQHTQECATPLTIKVKVNLLQSTERIFNPVSSKFKILILFMENRTFLLHVSSENFTLSQADNITFDDVSLTPNTCLLDNIQYCYIAGVFPATTRPFIGQFMVT